MSRERPAKIQVEWKVLYVDMKLVLLQAHSSLDVHKEEPEENGGQADTLL